MKSLELGLPSFFSEVLSSIITQPVLVWVSLEADPKQGLACRPSIWKESRGNGEALVVALPARGLCRALETCTQHFLTHGGREQA